MRYWIKVSTCALIVLTFVAFMLIAPEHPHGWVAILKGVLMTLSPIAFIYLLMLASRVEEKSSTQN